MRKALAAIAALVFPVLVLAAGPARAASLEPVTIANTSTNLQLVLPYIALKKGYFAAHGIAASMTHVNGDAGSIPALVSGSVDFSIMTSTPALTADAKGGDLKIISPLSTYPEQIVMRKKLADKLGITASTPLAEKLAALKGRKVGVLDIGGGLQYQVVALLISHGIDPREVPIVGLAPFSSELIALKRGEIDVIGPAVPFGQTAVKDGYGVMIANIWGGEVPSLRGTPFEVMAVRRKWGQAHAKTVAGVRAALQEAMDYLHKDPAGAAKFAHDWQPNIPLSVQTEAIGTGAGYPTSTTITKAEFAGMQSFAKLSGAKTAAITYDQAIWSK
ncbi:MAG: ABC transporter substrate-binding protein [Acetobacteraceae bacterium]